MFSVPFPILSWAFLQQFPCSLPPFLYFPGFFSLRSPVVCPLSYTFLDLSHTGLLFSVTFLILSWTILMQVPFFLSPFPYFPGPFSNRSPVLCHLSYTFLDLSSTVPLFSVPFPILFWIFLQQFPCSRPPFLYFPGPFSYRSPVLCHLSYTFLDLFQAGPVVCYLSYTFLDLSPTVLLFSVTFPILS